MNLGRLDPAQGPEAAKSRLEAAVSVVGDIPADAFGEFPIDQDDVAVSPRLLNAAKERLKPTRSSDRPCQHPIPIAMKTRIQVGVADRLAETRYCLMPT